MAKVLLSPETVFPEYEVDRVTATARRYALLMEEVERGQGTVEAYFSQFIKADRLRSWGPPDVSRNELAHVCNALTTPGHYGTAPVVIGEPAPALAPLAAPLWPRKQHAEYLAYGLGAVAIHVSAGDAGLQFTIVPPHELWALASTTDPTHPAVMRRLHRVQRPDGEAYAWAEWDVRDPEQPVYRWVLALKGGELGQDITREIVGDLEDPYPWRKPDGSGFLPWSVHRSRDVGDIWNHQRGRGAAIATMNAMLLSTYALKVARDGTGTAAIVSGMTPNEAYVSMASDGNGVRSVTIEPGDIIYHTPVDGSQPFVQTIGGADDLPRLSAFAAEYADRVKSDMGIVGSDAVRTGANPMSGSAMFIMRQSQRDEQRRAAPFCAAADVETLHHIGWLAGVNPDGVGVAYAEIPKSPDELRQEQEQDEFELAQGLTSLVDVYCRRHPGVTREQAEIELIRIQETNARLSANQGGTDAGRV